jgi:hypothetical protein
VTLIKTRLGMEAVTTPGKTGQFEVIADGETISERGGALAPGIPISTTWWSNCRHAVRVAQRVRVVDLESSGLGQALVTLSFRHKAAARSVPMPC